MKYKCGQCGYLFECETSAPLCPTCGSETIINEQTKLTHSIKGSQTEKNLMAAFIGESQARNKYTYFAERAKADGYEHIAYIFEETAQNEKAHAKVWAKILDLIGCTDDNLVDAINGEKYENQNMYPEYAKIAREEGFHDIAKKFELVAQIEKDHQERYQKLLDDLVSDETFQKRTGIAVWKCRNCGHIYVGKNAPVICPVCNKPQAYFEQTCDNQQKE